MKKILAIIAAIIFGAALVVGGFFFYKFHTPEYALAMTIKDVKMSGMDGLKAHLTADAAEKLEMVKDETDKSGFFGAVTEVAKDEAIGFLKSKMSEVEWTVEDILKGKKRADVIIGFQYGDSIAGTVAIEMIYENHTWKIDGIGIPDFDVLSLW